MQKSIFLILVLVLIITGGAAILFLSISFKPEPAVDFNETVVNLNINSNKNVDTIVVNNNINDNLPAKIYHINGVIERIEEDRMFVDAVILTGKTLRADKEGKTEIIEVIIKPNVRITELTFISNNGGKSYSPNEVDIELSDLKIGDKVGVISSSNIKGQDSFTATSIQLMQTSIK